MASNCASFSALTRFSAFLNCSASIRAFSSACNLASASLRAFISAFQRIFSLSFSAANRSACCFSCATFASAFANASASIASSFLNSCTTIGVKFDVNAQSSAVDCADINGLIKPLTSSWQRALTNSFSKKILD